MKDGSWGRALKAYFTRYVSGSEVDQRMNGSIALDFQNYLTVAVVQTGADTKAG